MQGSPKGTTGETLTIEPSVEAWRPPPLETDESLTRGGGDCLDIASFRRNRDHWSESVPENRFGSCGGAAAAVHNMG